MAPQSTDCLHALTIDLYRFPTRISTADHLFCYQSSFVNVFFDHVLRFNFLVESSQSMFRLPNSPTRGPRRWLAASKELFDMVVPRAMEGGTRPSFPVNDGSRLGSTMKVVQSDDGSHIPAPRRRGLPSAYSPWTPQEEAQLCLLVGRNKSIESIACQLQRTEGAITARMNKLGISGGGGPAHPLPLERSGDPKDADSTKHSHGHLLSAKGSEVYHSQSRPARGLPWTIHQDFFLVDLLENQQCSMRAAAVRMGRSLNAVRSRYALIVRRRNQNRTIASRAS